MQTRQPFFIILGCCSLVTMQTTQAQDRAPLEPSSLPAPDQPLEPVKPVIETLDKTRLRIGDVTLDRKTREIRFPAQVNMTDGLLEFLVVHEKGKVHESLLVTNISPTHLNLAFKLLRYTASPEFNPLPNATGGISGEFPDVAPEIKAGARITIDIEWKTDNAEARRMPASDWIQHSVKTTAMPPGPWVYGGSIVEGGKYIPEITGDLVAIFLAPSAIINYPGDDNNDDTVWLPFTKRVPEIGTNVTVIIAPYTPQPAPSAKP